MSQKNKQVGSIEEFELQVHKIVNNENDRYKPNQKNQMVSSNDQLLEGTQQIHSSQKKQMLKFNHLQQSMHQIIQAQNIAQVSQFDAMQIEAKDRNSTSSSNSELSPQQREEKDQNAIIELRQECSKVKSVPYNFTREIQHVNKKKRQMNSNYTRRIMTQNKIISNIMRRNDPEVPIKFNDFLVSCKTSNNIDYFGSNFRFNCNVKNNQNAKTCTFQNTINQSSNLSQASRQGKRTADNDNSISTNNDLQDSHLSNIRDKSKQKVQKQSNMQMALQKMATSSNTFLVTDNNNFEPNRVKNHKLFNKKGQLQDTNNKYKEQNQFELDQLKNIFTDITLNGMNQMSDYLKQNNQPQPIISLYKNQQMQSEQYLLVKNRNFENEKNRIDQQKSTLKQGYDQSPSMKQNSSPQNKFLNSTLMKTQSTVGRNHADIKGQISESPSRLLYVSDHIANGETELKREIIKNNENLKQLAAIVDHKIGFKFNNPNQNELDSQTQENDKFKFKLPNNNKFQKSSAVLNSNNHELQSQHDKPTIYYPSVNKLENVSIISQNFGKDKKHSLNNETKDDYSQNITPMRLERAENSSSHTQPLFVSTKNENIQLQNNYLQSDNHNSRMKVMQKVCNKLNDKKDNKFNDQQQNNLQLNKKLIQQEIYDEYNINKSPHQKLPSQSITNAEARDLSELATPSPVSNAQKLQNINSQILLIQKKNNDAEIQNNHSMEKQNAEIQDDQGKNILNNVNMFNSKILGTQRFQNSKQFVCTRLQMRANQLQSYRPHLVTNATLNQIIKNAIYNESTPQQLQTNRQLPNIQLENKLISSPVSNPIQTSTILTQNQLTSNNPTFKLAERTVITQNINRPKHYKNQKHRNEELSVDKLRNFQNTELNKNNLYKQLNSQVDSDLNSSQKPSTAFKWDKTQNILQSNWPISTQNKTNADKHGSNDSSNQPAIPINIQQNSIFHSQEIYDKNKINNSLEGKIISQNENNRPYDHPIFVKSLLSQDINITQGDMLLSQMQNAVRKPQTAGIGAIRQSQTQKSKKQKQKRDYSEDISQQQRMFGIQRGFMQSAQHDSKIYRRQMSSYKSNMKNLQIIQQFAVIQQKQQEFQQQFINYNPYNLSNQQ